MRTDAPRHQSCICWMQAENTHKRRRRRAAGRSSGGGGGADNAAANKRDAMVIGDGYGRPLPSAFNVCEREALYCDGMHAAKWRWGRYVDAGNARERWSEGTNRVSEWISDGGEKEWKRGRMPDTDEVGVGRSLEVLLDLKLYTDPRRGEAPPEWDVVGILARVHKLRREGGWRVRVSQRDARKASLTCVIHRPKETHKGVIIS